jgi:hypothetical protein
MRLIAWGMGGALYLAVLVLAGDVAAGPQATSGGAASAVSEAAVGARYAAHAGEDAAALVSGTVAAAEATENPLVTVAIAAAGLSVAGVTWLVVLVRRRLAGRERGRRARTSVRRITIPT